jgi:hypothetical protein
MLQFQGKLLDYFPIWSLHILRFIDWRMNQFYKLYFRGILML